ncbi:MAG: trypsin-like peptidase domain-containing protein [Candidatus Pacearchaeota archaeon]
MPLKRHHKWVIGSFSSFVVVALIVLAILLNGLIVKQNTDYNNLNDKIDELQSNIQSQINLLSESISDTQIGLEESQQELSVLKASIGEDFSGIYSNSVESVVIVSTNTGQGTGFIINEKGYIVTNNHVLKGATRAGIYDSEGNLYDVSLIGNDEFMDIALLKINGNFEKLELGDSDNVNVGEKVIAIGNPYGLVFSATVGSVSSVHREGPNGIFAYTQIDAAVNPGNSGGPLINNNGEVIGVVNFKISGEAEGLGFALESNYVKDTINEIYRNYANETLI